MKPRFLQKSRPSVRVDFGENRIHERKVRNIKRNNYLMAACLLAAFGLWTLFVCRIDVLAIGPQNSQVGFATLNGWFHGLTGVHWYLYVLTDWLGLVPVAICLGFAGLGLVQSIRRRSLRKVDLNLLALGGFYLLVMGAYLFFEKHVVNYRPVLIEGFLEASYPSSTTLLVLCVLPTARMQLRQRIQTGCLRRGVSWLLMIFELFMVIGRLISGVHWLTDIVGGVLLSGGLVALYRAVTQGKEKYDDRKVHIPAGEAGGDSGGL